jgi:hypothetical protein
VQGGIVGSWAIGRQVENTFHDIANIGRVHGWRAQLGNEFGAVGFWDRKWRFNHDLGNGYSWEIILGVELAAGNIFTYAETRFKIAEASTKKSPWATLWPVLRYFTRTISGPVSRFCLVPMSLRNSAGLIRSDLSNLSLAL